MACPSGYMERNGGCEYIGYLPGDANLDGTPNTTGDQGGNFWSQVGDAVSKYGPLILIGAGTFWQSKQGGGNNQPANTSNTPPAPASNKQSVPVWAWVLIAVAVLMLIVMLVRKK